MIFYFLVSRFGDGFGVVFGACGCIYGNGSGVVFGCKEDWNLIVYLSKNRKNCSYSAICENIIADANIDFTEHKMMKFEAELYLKREED